jgi:hypothetical protein
VMLMDWMKMDIQLYPIHLYPPKIHFHPPNISWISTLHITTLTTAPGA